MSRLEAFNEHRPLLFSIAYRMLGSAADAEDILQETFLRWQQAAADEIQSAKAYLSTIVTRLCINHLQSARVRREEYIGSWLPEPIVAHESESKLADSLSMAFLVLLERLSPVERAVFLLREVFDYDYLEVARIVGKSDTNCRQIFRRARQHISSRRPRFEHSAEKREEMLAQFIRALAEGDMQGLLALLSEDITLWSDGGGKAAAALRPIHGADRVSRFIFGALSKLAPSRRVPVVAEVNCRPAVVNYIEGRPQSVITIEVLDGLICAIYIISNPDKLQHLPDQSESLARS